MMKIYESILSGYLEKHSFDNDIKLSVNGLVASTLDIYEKIIKENLPIPSKFHYSYNLRNVS